MEPPEEDIDLFVEEYVHEPRFGGYDFVFVDELSPGQTCSICLVAMRNPVQTKCGHRFCEDCLLGTFRQGLDQTCPQDRNPIPEEGGFFRDVAWEREILSLRVKCKKIERGCDWTGQLRHYEEHFYECQYEDVVCDDCDEEMQRRFLDTHSTSECCNRIVQCDYCEEEFAFWRTEVHEGEECTRFPLECPQQCGIKEIPREEVDSHVKGDCLMTVVVCPYEGAGCTFHDKRINLKAHIEESSEDHLSKTWSDLFKAKQELDKVKLQIGGQVDGIEEHVEEIEGHVEEIQGHVEEIQGGVEKLQSEKEALETSLQRNGEEISELKLSEKKLEVLNMSLRKEVTVLGRQLAEVKLTAATENRSLKELVQAIQKRLETMEKKEEVMESSEEEKTVEMNRPKRETMNYNSKEEVMESFEEAKPVTEEEWDRPAYRYKPSIREEPTPLFDYFNDSKPCLQVDDFLEDTKWECKPEPMNISAKNRPCDEVTESKCSSRRVPLRNPRRKPRKGFGLANQNNIDWS